MLLTLVYSTFSATTFTSTATRIEDSVTGDSKCSVLLFKCVTDTIITDAGATKTAD